MKNINKYLRPLFLIFVSIITVIDSQGQRYVKEEGITYFYITPTGVTVQRLDDEILRSGEIVIPEVTTSGDSIVGLANYLFSGINYIKTVKLPSGITSIPVGCFRDCSNLERIESKNISSLGEECFTNCTSLRFLNGEEIVKNNTLYIPQSLTYIERKVFKGWDVEHLRIQPSDNDSKLRLDWGAFGEMNKLRTAEFFRNCYCRSASATGSTEFCFSGNPNLEEIRFSKDYMATDDWDSQIYYIKPTVILGPDLTLRIALKYYNELSERANLPALKKVIVENECFEPVAMDYGDAELIVNSEKFLLPHRSEFTLVYEETWKDEYGEIHEYEEWEHNFDRAIFWEYGALYSVKKLTIGENVKEICVENFENLSEITVHIPEPPEWNRVFPINVYSTATLRVPEQSVELYKNAPGWKRFNIIQAIGSAAVEDIDIDTVEPEYFDLTGRKVTSPEKGIYILKDSRGARKVVL